MGTTIFLLLVPLVVWITAAKLWFKHEFTIGEMAVQAGITSVVMIGLTFASFHSQTYDTMIINGAVTKLNPQRESCNMFWSDWPDGFCTNQHTRQVRDGQTCTTNNKGVRSCTPKYKTQYRSVYSWERRYFVTTDLPEVYEISRVDAQGVNTPPRFAEIKIGDPVSTSVSYTNYIKGAASTLFNVKYEDVPPIAYPKIYDYYKARRVIYFGVPASFDFVKQWEGKLAELNTSIRKTKANVIIVVVDSTRDWAERLAQAWDAHNINDIVVVIGTQGDTITWVDVRSWSSDELVDITIRDEILKIGNVDPDKINNIIYDSVVRYYKMQSMDDFEYLADDIPPPMWMYIIAAIVLLIISPAVTWWLANNEHNSH